MNLETNITKRLMINKLILLIIIIAFVNMFSFLFGTENTLTGVTVITGALMFKDIDLGYNVKESVFITIGLFTFIGIVTYLTSQVGILIGILINLISVFMVIYITSENLQTKVFLPFILLYVFLDGTPIDETQAIMRVVASFIGGVIMALTLYISHYKKQISKKSIKEDLCKENIDFSSERFRFSVKMAIGISIAILIGRVLNTQKAMWITIAVMSLTQPQHEDSKQRMKERLISTILGAIAFVILFKVLVPQKYFTFVTLSLGYIYTFIYEYKIKMFFVAINALVASMFIFNTPTSIVLRIGFLAIGICVVYIISKGEEVISKIKEKEQSAIFE